MNPLNCPLSSRNFDSVYSYLVDLPMHRLILITQQVMATLSPVEAFNYNINKFCHHFDDRRGRIAFLKKLVDDGVIMPLQYPHNALSNPKLAKMLSTAHYVTKIVNMTPDVVNWLSKIIKKDDKGEK